MLGYQSVHTDQLTWLWTALPWFVQVVSWSGPSLGCKTINIPDTHERVTGKKKTPQKRRDNSSLHFVSRWYDLWCLEKPKHAPHHLSSFLSVAFWPVLMFVYQHQLFDSYTSIPKPGWCKQACSLNDSCVVAGTLVHSIHVISSDLRSICWITLEVLVPPPPPPPTRFEWKTVSSQSAQEGKTHPYSNCQFHPAVQNHLHSVTSLSLRGPHWLYITEREKKNVPANLSNRWVLPHRTIHQGRSILSAGHTLIQRKPMVGLWGKSQPPLSGPGPPPSHTGSKFTWSEFTALA